MRDHDDTLISELSAHYGRLLQAGFITLRQAVASSDLDWIQAEIEFLHNIPSLIGESNILRHEHFWNKERIAYIEWATVPGRELQNSRLRTYYQPIWNDMDSAMKKILDRIEATNQNK